MDIRELVGGALNNHKFYLKFIAIPNCNEFFYFYDSNFREFHKIDSEVDRYVCVRKFLIAVESLNNVFDYFYHEFHQEIGKIIPRKIYKVKDEDFKTKALGIIGLGCMNEVVEMANAYKHSRRRREIYKINSAKDLIGARRYGVDFGSFNLIPLDGGFYLPRESQVMALREAVKFWVDYCGGKSHVSRSNFESILR